MQPNYDLPVYRTTWPDAGLCAFAFAAGLYLGAWITFPLAMLVVTGGLALLCMVVLWCACAVAGGQS